MDDQLKFCSECKYSKEYITEDKILLICTRYQHPSNIKAELWHKTSTIYRKFNATACAYYDAKGNR